MGPGATQSAASAAVEAVLSSILTLSAQDRLHITRFGTFAYTTPSPRRFYHIPSASFSTTTPAPRLTFHPAKNFPHQNL